MGAILIPGVDHRQLPNKSTVLLDPKVINIHTMVWDLASCERYFAGRGRPYSHVGTGYDGEVRQWQDLRFRAASCLHGNPRNISIENADTGPGFPRWSGSDVPDFTDAQAEALVVVISWLCHRFGIPKSAIGSSCAHERGVGWHRLGVSPWRQAGCSAWSSATGKVCPGDRRIHQLRTEIIPAVSAPTVRPEDVMNSQQERELHKKLDRLIDRIDNKGSKGGLLRPVWERSSDTNAKATAILGVVRKIAADNPAVDIDEAELAREILPELIALLTPQEIAGALSEDLAEQLADVLAERLTS